MVNKRSNTDLIFPTRWVSLVFPFASSWERAQHVGSRTYLKFFSFAPSGFGRGALVLIFFKKNCALNGIYLDDWGFSSPSWILHLGKMPCPSPSLHALWDVDHELSAMGHGRSQGKSQKNLPCKVTALSAEQRTGLGRSGWERRRTNWIKMHTCSRNSPAGSAWRVWESEKSPDVDLEPSFCAWTQTVPSVLGLFPRPNCDQMHVKLGLMELLCGALNLSCAQ